MGDMEEDASRWFELTVSRLLSARLTRR